MKEYNIGNIFQIKKNEYILACTSAGKNWIELAMICLSTGNRWIDPIRFQKRCIKEPITKSEIAQLVTPEYVSKCKFVRKSTVLCPPDQASF